MNKHVDVKYPCQRGCGREFSPAGKQHHEKFCTGPGYEPGRTHYSKPNRAYLLTKAKDKNKTPCPKGCGALLSVFGMTRHKLHCTGPGYKPGSTKNSSRERKKQEEVKYTGEKDMVYELFFDDAALYACVMHLLEARDDKNVLCNLKAAKDMIDTKIRFLES